jgi:predicted GNAT family N-acyltransferase
MIIQVKQISSNEAKARAFAIRMRVFVREQGVPADIELDHDDQRAIHFLATASGKAIGTARVVVHGQSAKIGRMAVLKSYRRRSVGTALLKRAVAAAKRRNGRRIYLNAQVAVIGFYERNGFRCVGPVFTEAGIRHRKMFLTEDGLKTKSANNTKRM